MKKFIIPVILLTAVSFFTSSCTEDKGHYDYTDIIEIVMPVIPAEYRMEVLDRLVIEPDWKYPQGRTAEDFNYTWVIESSTQGMNGFEWLYKRDTISREPTLDFELSVPLLTYDIYCFVTDKIDDRVYSISTSVQVINSYTTGMMVLSNIDGYADVSFINVFGDVQENLYSAINGQYAGYNPTHIKFSGNNRNTMFSAASHKHTVFILCDDDDTGGVICDPFSLEKMYPISERFIFPTGSVKPAYLHDPVFGVYEMLVNDGKVHTRNLSSDYPLFDLPTTSEHEFYLFPQVSYVSILMTVGYCNLQQKFVYMTGESNTVLHHYDPSDYNATVPYNPGYSTGREMIYAFVADENRFGTTQTYRAILKDGDGKKYIYGANVSSWDSDPEKGMKRGEAFVPTFLTDLSVHPELDGADTYATSANAALLFFGKGNTIYSFGAESGAIFSTLTMDIPSGESIDYMEVEQKNGLLYVGVSDGSGTSGSGSVYVYSVSTSTGVLTLEQTYRNMAGRIVDFGYKQM